MGERGETVEFVREGVILERLREGLSETVRRLVSPLAG
jgi:hypothetical protein